MGDVTYATMAKLSSLALENKCTIEFYDKKKYFILRKIDDPDNWCWIASTHDGTKIKQVRTISLSEWERVISDYSKMLNNKEMK